MNDEREGLVRRFVTAWQGRGGHVEIHDSPAAARLSLLLTLREVGAREILSWPPEALPLPGLAEALADAGIAMVYPDRGRLRADLAVGLTGAAAGLAATGAIVLAGPSPSAWLPALLSVYHIVLLPVTQLFPHLAGWQRARGEEEPGSMLIIGGPSLSADIEWHGHTGMFGPRQIRVFLLPAAEAGR